MSSSSDETLGAIVVVLVIIVICIKYIAIVAGIGLVLFGLFHLFKYLYIGRVDSAKADPLFTKAAKEAVKKNGFDEHRFQQENALSNERMRFLLTQLDLAGIYSEKKTLVANQWELHSVFRVINADKDYFLDQIYDRAHRLQEDVDKQIKVESDKLSLLLLSSLRKSIRNEFVIDYLSLKLQAIQAYAAQGEIDSLAELINRESSTCGSIGVSESRTTMELFHSFCSNLGNDSSTKVWDSSHKELKIEHRSFLHILVNDEELLVPHLDLNKRSFYFYPSFIIIASYSGNICNSFQVVSYDNVEVRNRSLTNSRAKWFNSGDAEVAYTTWLHTRRDGGPDLRYSYNPTITYYQFYEAHLSGLNLTVLSGKYSAISSIKEAFSIIKRVDASSRAVSETLTRFEFLGEHEWKELPPSDIKLAGDFSFPEWEHTYIYSRTAILDASKEIQEAYKSIRRAFLDGVYYDLSDTTRTNYGFVLFYDLFEAYLVGKSDIEKLCKELDVLSISCGETERFIKITFEDVFKRESIPQYDKDFASAYFCFTKDEDEVDGFGLRGKTDSLFANESVTNENVDGNSLKNQDDEACMEKNEPRVCSVTSLHQGAKAQSLDESREKKKKDNILSSIVYGLSTTASDTNRSSADVKGNVKKKTKPQKQRIDISMKNDLTNAILACQMRRGENACLDLVEALHKASNLTGLKSSREYYSRLKSTMDGFHYSKGVKEYAPVVKYILSCKMNDVSDVSLMALVGTKFPALFRK